MTITQPINSQARQGYTVHACRDMQIAQVNTARSVVIRRRRMDAEVVTNRGEKKNGFQARMDVDSWQPKARGTARNGGWNHGSRDRARSRNNPSTILAKDRAHPLMNDRFSRLALLPKTFGMFAETPRKGYAEINSEQKL